MNSELQQKVDSWLSPTFDSETQRTIKSLQDNDPKTLEESFYKD